MKVSGGDWEDGGDELLKTGALFQPGSDMEADDSDAVRVLLFVLLRNPAAGELTDVSRCPHRRKK